MSRLFLDIETIPASEESLASLEKLYAKKSKGAAMPAGRQEDFDEYHRKTSFDGSYGRILCIGYAVDDDEVDVLHNEGNEKETLRQFWELAKSADLFIGHNVMDFDLRFIYQRSIVNNIVPSVDLNFARYRNYPIYDTMKEWAKWSMNSIGLEHLALALGIPTPKDGIDGSQVWDFYQKGKVQEILDYCKRDVETTRAVYKRMIFED
jgi:3'-5' exonuclease